jgi:hypothetical protein
LTRLERCGALEPFRCHTAVVVMLASVCSFSNLKNAGKRGNTPCNPQRIFVVENKTATKLQFQLVILSQNRLI